MLSTIKHGNGCKSADYVKWMGDHYMLGFAFVSTLRFLRSQIVCMLYTSPLTQ